MPKLTIEQRKAGYLEKGMWVAFDEKIAILVAFGGEVSLIHFVRADGSTIEHVTDEGHRSGDQPVPTSRLRKARLSEIPERRRPSAEIAAQFGYE